MDFGEDPAPVHFPDPPDDDPGASPAGRDAQTVVRDLCRDLVCLKVNKGMPKAQIIETFGIVTDRLGSSLPSGIKDRLPRTWEQVLQRARGSSDVERCVPIILLGCPRVYKRRGDGSVSNVKISSYTSGHYVFREDAEDGAQCEVCKWVSYNIMTRNGIPFMCTLFHIYRNLTGENVSESTCFLWTAGCETWCATHMYWTIFDINLTDFT